MSGVETAEDYGEGEAGGVARWLAEIKAYDSEFNAWEIRAGKVVKRYRDERDASESGSRFNVLWSNIQTLQPATYARTPEPAIVRKNKDRDPFAVAAADILERSTSSALEEYDLDEEMKLARDDYLLTARGQAWVRYVPYYGDEKSDRVALQTDGETVFDDDGPVEEYDLDEMGNPFRTETYRPIVDEQAICEYINWKDFGHTPAPTWGKVRTVWKAERLTRDQLRERFPKVADKVALTERVQGATDDNAKAFPDVFKRAVVYEIWDKVSRTVYWISPGYKDGYLDQLEDPLKLKDFFPCPRPMYGTRTGDSLIPVPDFYEYQDQAAQLDSTTARISVLTKVLKVAGAYAGEQDATLEGIIQGGDNTLVPVPNWTNFAENGGLDGAISWLPIDKVATVLQGLIQLREQIKADLYEISGMGDIVRGVSDPRETYGAQNIKSKFGTLRLQDKQAEVQRFCRDIVRLKAEIIAEHFSDETILEMSGWNNSVQARQVEREQPGAWRYVFDEALKIIRSDRTRGFKVSIETDSTIQDDLQEEKQARTEFITAFTALLAQAIPAAAQSPALGKPLMETVMFAVRGFKAGRQLETAWESAFEELAGQQDAPQGEGPDPEQEKASLEMAKMQAERERLEREGEMAIQEHQFKMKEMYAKHEATMAELAVKSEMQRAKEAQDTRQAQLSAVEGVF